MRIKHWLIVRADGTLRINAKNPSGRLGVDEIAVPIEVTIPEAWGRVRTAAISITMPEPPEIVDREATHSDEGQVG